MGKSNEKQRAWNIIWSVSKDYSLTPDITAYDERGKADLYWNYIIGAVYKYFDYRLLSEFFDTLRYDRDYIFYQKIMMLGLEGCIFEKDSKNRPVLTGLRSEYGKKAYENRDEAELFDEIQAAYFSRVNGYTLKIRDNINSLLDDLNFDISLGTGQLVFKMEQIIKKYFEPEYNDEFYIKKIKRNRLLHFFGRKHPSIRRSIKGGTLTLIGNDEGKGAKGGKIFSGLLKLKEKSDNKEREFIKDYFGISTIGETNTKALEKVLCDEAHESCHLHFTRGQFDDTDDAIFRQKQTSVQRDKNKKHYIKNYIRNTNNIAKLTQRIKNAIIVNYTYSMKSESGKLATEKTWRTILNDSKIFIKIIKDEMPDISVDIMLDASASQLNRQETIAEEGYIIAESLTRCNIPVRIYSFCNMRDYTVMNLFRDYNEINNNDRIFSYCAAGFNRDGMALRTALHMMGDSKYNHKILIVLSDVKPNDMLGVASEGFLPLQKEYSAETGVNDTANEVRKGWKQGVSILCVFTGRDEDIPSVKKIYGQKFTRILTLDKFAEMVGLLIEKELINR
ncbi:MAG TPA: hypothetical protein PLX37_03310 [Sedimentibacter sp.]|nr:hypothetical protein [Sedimentibacter sp.]HNZ82790.1 hypothetical protein [Sedimentibacter sp.]HOH69473.1 hypothetical protein [Sedimentibacter sp.]